MLEDWKTVVKAGVGIKRATALVEKAGKSIGIEVGLRFAKQELHSLLDQYELHQHQLEELDREIEALLEELPGAKEMLAIKGLGVITIATFFAEVGDITKYRHPQQLVNMAGLALREHSSGKYKGQTRISKRGRKKLRKALYLAVRPLVANNSTFKALHTYYTTRPSVEEAAITYCSVLQIVACTVCHWSKAMRI